MQHDMTRWTVRHALAEAADRWPERIFLQIVDGPSTTYGEMHNLARRVAGGLASLGLRKGDQVMTMLPNGQETIAAWLGCGVLGAVEVSLNTAYRGAPLVHAANACNAQTIIIDAGFLPSLAEIRDQTPGLRHVIVLGAATPDERLAGLTMLSWEDLVSGDVTSLEAEPLLARDLAAILYTSGTTGPAKPVLLTHAQNHLTAIRTRECLHLTEDDISYCFHPMFHMAGKFMGVYGTLLAGAKMVLDRRFVPETWVSRVREFGATVGYGHGPMLEMIHAVAPSPHDRDHAMTRVLAAPFPRRIARDFEHRFGVRGLECWGMTEIGIITWPDMDQPLAFGSCGKVDPALFELRIVDPESDEEMPAGEAGEMVVRARRPWLLFQGYLGMAEATVEAWRNGWFHTGDTGSVDAEGNFYFHDRIKDKIRRRAENISSYDIESAACAYPAVAEAAAVGVPSEFEGDDDIKLAVVLRQGATLDPVDLITFLAHELPHHMVPRYIETLTSLPRSPTNKIMKVNLRVSGAGENTWDRKAAGISLREIIGKDSRRCN